MKTIIITGANGNLGTATVKKFLEDDYRVIAVDAAATNLAFADGNSNFEFRTVNLTDEALSASFIEDVISKYGSIDGALLLVGGFAMGDIHASNGTDLQKQISLNFETAFFTARPLFTHMQQKGYGRLVFVGARPAINPAQGRDLLVYALSKSLLFKFAELLNETAKGTNITASVIVPSTIDTALNRKSMPDANPDNWVKAEAIADVLEFICSDKGGPVREPVYKLYNNA